jgi:exopolyphosphatase/guanosine-5'-triphosphate,3'-diphosphate pyrophosphatase
VDPATLGEAPARDTLAAVDLGSNSFHMIIAQLRDGGSLHVVDRLREQVQLAAGLDDERRLSGEAGARALGCLERFGERLRGLPQGKVRAVGTNTLRSMRSSGEFLRLAQRALGHPIEVIDGHEEARLIYLGVAHTLADDQGRRLVIDIGGGSTEFIIGQRFEPRYRESLYMGCVSASRRHFPEGALTEAAFERAQIAARIELEAIERQYRRVGWDDCIGSSGTIKAVRLTLVANGWSADAITRKGLEKVRRSLVRAGTLDAVALDGLSRERAAVFPGGLAILTAAFDSLGIEEMKVSDGALREGLIYDLLGRIGHEDVREGTIGAMARRYQVSQRFSQRVAQTVEACRAQVEVAWGLAGEEQRTMLRWAAWLHELGVAISHHSHHKHGAYLLRYSDMPGFSRQDQVLLSLLIRGHRRRFPKDDFAELPEPLAGTAARMCILLRLAVLLNHGRSPEPLPRFDLAVNGEAMELVFPEGWLDRHPLTRANLEQEAEHLKAARLRLTYR